MLDIYEVFGEFVSKVIAPIAAAAGAQAELESMLAMLNCLRLFHLVHLRRVDTSIVPLLQEHTKTHLQLFQLAYGHDACKPKHHYGMHLPQQFQAQGYLWNTLRPRKETQI